MNRTNIQWTDRTWNPVRGCSRVSKGCQHCYAEVQALRITRMDRARGVRVELIPEKLDEPLSWRKPQRVFLNSMSDLFHEALPDEAIDAVVAVMALARRHTFQLLTKRSERMRAYARRVALSVPHDPVNQAVFDAANASFGGFAAWPLPNVWLGVSVEDQTTADARIPDLLLTPAAVRFVSAEPLLGPVDFSRVPMPDGDMLGSALHSYMAEADCGLDQIIFGGESGRAARPCDVAWIRDGLRQCREADVAAFVKQLGSRAYDTASLGELSRGLTGHFGPPEMCRIRLSDGHGGDPAEWPADLRVREFPEVCA